jgi:hypothetical protein
LAQNVNRAGETALRAPTPVLSEKLQFPSIDHTRGTTMLETQATGLLIVLGNRFARRERGFDPISYLVCL